MEDDCFQKSDSFLLQAFSVFKIILFWSVVPSSGLRFTSLWTFYKFKDHCWTCVRESFLLASVRWLRNNAASDNRRAVIDEALEVIFRQ